MTERQRIVWTARCEDANVESMYFISTLPWLHYSALIQPVAGGEESNPRITWGAFAPDAEGRLQMPVTLLVHHALADGSHITSFDALRAELTVSPGTRLIHILFIRRRQRDDLSASGFC